MDSERPYERRSGWFAMSVRDLIWAGSLIVSVAVSWGSQEAKIDALEKRVARTEGATVVVTRVDASLTSVDQRLERIERWIDSERRASR